MEAARLFSRHSRKSQSLPAFKRRAHQVNRSVRTVFKDIYSKLPKLGQAWLKELSRPFHSDSYLSCVCPAVLELCTIDIHSRPARFGAGLMTRNAQKSHNFSLWMVLISRSNRALRKENFQQADALGWSLIARNAASSTCLFPPEHVSSLAVSEHSTKRTLFRLEKLGRAW